MSDIQYFKIKSLFPPKFVRILEYEVKLLLEKHGEITLVFIHPALYPVLRFLERFAGYRITGLFVRLLIRFSRRCFGKCMVVIVPKRNA